MSLLSPCVSGAGVCLLVYDFLSVALVAFGGFSANERILGVVLFLGDGLGFGLKLCRS
jgi:hypothetical protein